MIYIFILFIIFYKLLYWKNTSTSYRWIYFATPLTDCDKIGENIFVNSIHVWFEKIYYSNNNNH
jgi:hypothetical protein